MLAESADISSPDITEADIKKSVGRRNLIGSLCQAFSDGMSVERSAADRQSMPAKATYRS
jgi:hypothetical protein